MKTIQKIALMAGVFLALLAPTHTLGCNNSALSLTSVTFNNNIWEVRVSLCIGAGRSATQFGGDDATGPYFSFAIFGNPVLRNKVIYWTPTVTSDTLGATFVGDTLGPGYGLGEVTNIVYSDPEGFHYFTCIHSTAECGSAHIDCSEFIFRFQGVLPDSIRALGIEGAPPFGGCYPNEDMIIRFTCPTANAGTDRQINSGACATLSGSGVNGVPPYTYAWSNGATTASTTVCPGTSTTYTLTVTDSRNCSSTDQVLVSINPCSSFAANAGSDATVYYGYLPQSCTALSATASGAAGPYTYLWSTGATTNTLNVCPTVTTTYTVTVTSAQGCTATDQVVVNVVDVRCGPNGNKVIVCRNGIQKCINLNQVGTHLAGGWSLGACANKSGESLSVTEEVVTPWITVAPNPITDAASVRFMNPGDGQVKVSLWDLQGHEVRTLYSGTPAPGEEVEVSLNANGLANGMYLIMMQLPDGARLTQKVMIHP